MSSAPRKKTGGRTKGTPNKATAARKVGAAEPAAPAPVPPLSPGSRARARGPAVREVEKEPAPQGLSSTFPRYKLVRIAELVPYANNARTHSREQVEKIAASIREFGFTNPILTDGKRGIVAGHGRVLAAELLGMDVAPSIELSHLTPEQRRAYIIADNKLALDAGWDDDLLRLELGELREDGFDLSLTGFDTPELDKLFAPDPEGPAGFPSFDETIETEHVCPSCGYKFSGGKTVESGGQTAGDGEGEC